jgi:hypothetical protein
MVAQLLVETFSLDRAEIRFTEVLIPWIVMIGLLGFLTAWLVVAIIFSGTGRSI